MYYVAVAVVVAVLPWRVILRARSKSRPEGACEREALHTDDGAIPEKAPDLQRPILDEVTNWDVFVSHRGPDVKSTFVDLLEYALQERAVFVDKSGLEPGQHNWRAMLAALKQANIVLVVMSPNYQKSPWCLEEFRTAMQLGKTVMIVYYGGTSRGHIDEDGLKASLGELKKHPQIVSSRRDGEILDAWRSSLKKAVEIVSWKYNTQEMLKDIVWEVETGIRRALSSGPSSTSGVTFGLEPRVNHLRGLLGDQEAAQHLVRRVGLLGMGGVGKTTLARALHTRLMQSCLNSRFCFVPDIRAKCKEEKGVEELQTMILKRVAGRNVAVYDAVEGRRCLESYLSPRPVVLVLDDVESGNVRDIVGSIDCLGAGSTVIITSRDRDALESMSAGCRGHVVLVDFLDAMHSRELFLLHCGSIPHGVTDNMVDDILSKCSGLPLSLKVVGAMLGEAAAGKEVVTWEETARKLEEAGEISYDGENLFKQLRISIDSLDAGVREMFLDVACIMLGWRRTDVMAHWAGRPHFGFYPITGLDTLQKRCLLTFRRESGASYQKFVRYEKTPHVSICTSGLPPTEHISMHDQLRDLGRALEKTNMGEALDWPARKRVWEECEYKSISEVGWSACKGLRMLMHPPWEVVHGTKDFHVLQNLRFIDFGSSASPLPQRLGELRRLQHISLSYSVPLTELPDSFCQLTALHCLDLSHCQLKRLPPDFHQLSALRYLQLCISGDAEPYSILDSLSRLSVLEQLELDISNNSELVDLPADFLQARKALVRLDARNCPQLAAVEGLRHQPLLTSLNLSGCPLLTALPDLDTTCLAELYAAGTALEGVHIAELFKASTAPWQVCSLDHAFCGFRAPPVRWRLGDNAHQVLETLAISPTKSPRSLEVECVACGQDYADDWYTHGSYAPYVNHGSYFEIRLLRGEQVVGQYYVCSNRVAYKLPELHRSCFKASHPLIASMQTGDRVELAAHTRYLGWTNNVWHAGMRWVQ